MNALEDFVKWEREVSVRKADLPRVYGEAASDLVQQVMGVSVEPGAWRPHRSDEITANIDGRRIHFNVNDFYLSHGVNVLCCARRWQRYVTPQDWSTDHSPSCPRKGVAS